MDVLEIVKAENRRILVQLGRPDPVTGVPLEKAGYEGFEHPRRYAIAPED